MINGLCCFVSRYYKQAASQVRSIQ